MSGSAKHEHLEIRSDPAELAGVRRRVEAFLSVVGMSEVESTRVELALDEALTNVIRYAYDNRTDERIEIDLASNGSDVCLTVRDYGARPPEGKVRRLSAGTLRPGGLGVHIMYECMDHVNYQPAEGGGTVLTMCRRMRGECPPETGNGTSK